MKEIQGLAGEHIEKACAKLAREAPAFMVFNGVRVEAKLGDTAGDLQARWSEGMDLAAKEYERKRAAHEATPEGQAELAAARRRADDEKRARTEALAGIEASGVRTKFAWEDGMGEISGFGGGYEAACRDMVYAGLAWLVAHSDADLSTWKTDDAKALERAVLAVCPDCSGAMHGATTNACAFIAKQGWGNYVEAMKKSRAVK